MSLQQPSPTATVPSTLSPLRKYIRGAAINSMVVGAILLVVCPWAWLIPLNKDDNLIVQIGIGVGGPVLALWLLLYNSRFLRNPYSHPALKWPRYGDPGQVADAIDRDLALTDQHVKYGAVTMMPQWMMRKSRLNLDCVPYWEIAWAYKKVIQGQGYGLYGLLRKTYVLQIETDTGRSFVVSGITPKQIDTLVQQLAPRTPWAANGHSKETQRAWDSNRLDFLASVESRRMAILHDQKQFPRTFDVDSAEPQNPW
jgi:hypothetical protein